MAKNPFPVVVNEIAWMGDKKSNNNEWIELYNNSSKKINLKGWSLKSSDGRPTIRLSGYINGKGFYLLKRKNNDKNKDDKVNLFYTGALSNKGEYLVLYNKENKPIDSVDCLAGWFAGNNKTKQTMERVNPLKNGSLKNNWQNSLFPEGSPKAKNNKKTMELIQEKKKLSFLLIFFSSLMSVFSAIIILYLRKHLTKTI